ncbi:MAG: glycosyltransferase family 4 protein [Desulfitobacteriaceae bacterium]|nr:glycosyltransferase family 4 protein [Desulfitobacteriaceae bacterium]MDD4752094.1 glycosyltransferase family 4 protein [Desulfitobacteriaceae bacterium]
MTKKILFVATMYTHLANFHKPFIRLLQDRGYEVHAAASNAEGRREEIEAIGVRCWEIPFSRVPISRINLASCRLLKEILDNERFELVHVHTPVAGLYSRWLAKISGQKVIYTAHGFHFFRGAPFVNWLVYYPAERLAARWTDGLIVMNEEDFAAGKRMGFIPGKTLYFVHGVGVSLSDFYSGEESSGCRESLGIPAEHIVVTCVADITPRKNHSFLLDAWQVLAQRNRKIHLVLVGEGRFRPDLEKRVSGENIPRVYFIGFRNDVPEILRGSDIVTLVSRHEGLPKCLMEAMACGKPVVASDVRGNHDIVKDGETGLLISLNSVPDLVRALERLADDKLLREKMGEAGRRRIENYSLDRVLKEMAIIYDMFLRC